MPDGARNRDELYEIFNLVLDGLGLEQGEQALMESPIQAGSAPGGERRRALGLALARRDPDSAARARELLRAALQSDAEDGLAWMRLGDVAESDEEQERCYRRALMAAPNWDFARSNLARFLVHVGRPGEALEFTSGYESRSQDVLVAHGQALIGVGYYEEAASAIGRAIAEAAKPWPSLYYDKWYAEMECGWHEAALATACQAQKFFPEDPLWYIRMARALGELERIEQAWSVLETAQQAGLEPQALLREQFELAWRERDVANAWAILEQFLQAEAGEPPVPDRLTWAEEKTFMLLVETGRLPEARRLLAGKSLGADGWGNAAWTAMLSDQHAYSLELAQCALELDPGHYAGMYARAQALSELDQEDQALEALQALREAHPNEHHAYEKLALYAAAAGEPADQGVLADAFELADQGVLLGPHCPYAWATRGYVYFVRGQLVEALADLQLAWTRADSRQRPKTPIFWWLLGILQDDQALVDEMRQAAQEKATTAMACRMIARVEALLAVDEEPSND